MAAENKRKRPEEEEDREEDTDSATSATLSDNEANAKDAPVGGGDAAEDERKGRKENRKKNVADAADAAAGGNKVLNDETSKSTVSEEDDSETEASGEFCSSITVDESIKLPQEFFKMKELSSVLNLETWTTVLEERERMFLRHFLPGGTAVVDEGAGGFLDSLLSGDCINFGNPAKRFFKDILSGRCHPEVVKMRGILNDLNFNMFFQSLRQHQNGLIDGFMEDETYNNNTS